MNKRIDELQSVFEAEFSERFAIVKALGEFAWTKEVETECIRAGIRAVVAALRDEIVEDGNCKYCVATTAMYNQILGDAGDEVAGRVGDTKHPDVTSPAADPAPAHSWFEYKPNLITCRACGIVRRADGKNKPCKGVVRVGPRATAPAPAVCEWVRNLDDTGGRFSTTCSIYSFYGGREVCPQCSRPIKFTEAQ